LLAGAVAVAKPLPTTPFFFLECSADDDGGGGLLVVVVATVAEGLLRQAPNVIKYYYRLFSCCSPIVDTMSRDSSHLLCACSIVKLWKIFRSSWIRSSEEARMKKANPSQSRDMCQLLGIKVRSYLRLGIVR